MGELGSVEGWKGEGGFKVIAQSKCTLIKGLFKKTSNLLMLIKLMNT